jgi:2-isopropylmalate synthase
LIENQNETTIWNTVGAGTNVIEASWLALVDSIEYGLMVVHPLTPEGA